MQTLQLPVHSYCGGMCVFEGDHGPVSTVVGSSGLQLQRLRPVGHRDHAGHHPHVCRPQPHPELSDEIHSKNWPGEWFESNCNYCSSVRHHMSNHPNNKHYYSDTFKMFLTLLVSPSFTLSWRYSESAEAVAALVCCCFQWMSRRQSSFLPGW